MQQPNADQLAYWNSRAGERWAASRDAIDAAFAPLTAAALDRADARPGERILDVGCGCGTTTLALARSVGPDGTVLGLDVSTPMLDAARGRVRDTNVRFVLADAATHPFGRDALDLVFSRFGVMFFDDPVAAFVNLRSGLRPGGRLVFACWRPLAENAWFDVPVRAVLPFAPPSPSADPHAPGPFAFADPSRVRAILDAAGVAGVQVAPHEAPVSLAGPGDLDGAVRFASTIGPASRLLAEVDGAARPEALAALRSALAQHRSTEGVALGGAIWIVSGHAT